MSATEHKPYPSYKDSGMEWLGEIPAHWDVHRLKEVAAIQMSNVDKKSVEGEEPVELCNYTDVYYNDRISPAIEFMKATAPRDQIRRFALRRGDVLITKDSESWTDIAVPAVVVEDLPHVLCGYHLAHIRPSPRVYGPYLARAIGAIGPRDQFRVAANGVTRFAIGTEAVATSVFAIPPLDEQHTIAAFLDRETARIDALVAKKERLIALLQERRTALITRAVTRGLDPTVPVKDSGVEWLGEIPAHWTTTPLKRVGEIQAGAGFPDDEQGILDEEVPFFKVGDMGMPGNEREMIVHQHSVSRATARRLRAFVFRPGTIVFAKVGAALLLNRRRLLVRPSAIDNNMMGFTPVDCDSAWAMYWLTGLDLGELANPGAVPSVNEGQVRETPVALPPVEEQRAISAFLDWETARIDLVIARARDAIMRLSELRAALISAAVTGKIDIREAAQ